MKNKLLKTCFVGCLATCLTLTGVFAFAPLGANVQAINTNQEEITESAGLISPKEDDPVLFTTESGLEIKYGNALPDTYNPSLASGNLAGFPYFTTNDGNEIYTWVMVGIGGKPENNTPAGVSINDDVNYDNKVIFSFANYEDIVLTIYDYLYVYQALFVCNSCVEAGIYKTNYAVDSRNGDWSTSNIRTAMRDYYNNSLLGLKEIKSNIIECNLNTTILIKALVGQTYQYVLQNKTTADYIFPLSKSITDSFGIDSLYSLSCLKLTEAQWLRGTDSVTTVYVPETSTTGSYYYAAMQYIDTDGSIKTRGVTSTAGYRPAFVMNLI